MSSDLSPAAGVREYHPVRQIRSMPDQSPVKLPRLFGTMDSRTGLSE